MTCKCSKTEVKRCNDCGRALYFLARNANDCPTCFENEVARVKSCLVVSEETGCWEWAGHLDGRGYGKLRRFGRSIYAHRYLYELAVGAVPAGLNLDHLCRNPACANPAHLEAVTQRENIMRGEGIAAKNAAKTHCPNGHAFAEHGEIVRSGKYVGRRCKICSRARERVRMAKKRAELRGRGLSARGRPLCG